MTEFLRSASIIYLVFMITYAFRDLKRIADVFEEANERAKR